MSSEATASPDAILHLITLKLLSEAGFPSTSKAASLTLSSIASRYIRTVGTACIERANLSGRGKAGAGDVVDVLAEMGQDIDDLSEWMLDGDMDRFKGGFEGMKDDLSLGLDSPEPLAYLSIRERANLKDDLGSDEESAEYAQDMIMEDIDMELMETNHLVSSDTLHHRIRSKSPDLSWLPPLPGQTPLNASTSTLLNPYPSSTSLTTLSTTEPNGKQSLYQKYQSPTSFTTSQLSQTFKQPPSNYTSSNISAPTSSLPALLRAWEETAGEPSASLAQTPLRQQAADIYRRIIAPPSMFDVEDTLSPTLTYNLPGPSYSPISAAAPIPPIPSTSTSSNSTTKNENDPDDPTSTSDSTANKSTLPIPVIRINKNPITPLSKLIREIRSPYLPPSLRERLTTIRPPTALTREVNGMKEPIYYGEEVRGPDEFSLNKEKGKKDPENEGKSEFYRYTWDNLRGTDKWSKGLPKGKKVVQWGQGEDLPRTQPRSDVIEAVDGSVVEGAENARNGGDDMMIGVNGENHSIISTTTTSTIVPPAKGLKLKLERSPSTSTIQQLPTPSTASSANAGQPKLKINTKSISPNLTNPSTPSAIPKIKLSSNSIGSQSISDSPQAALTPGGISKGGLKIKLPRRESMDTGK